MQQPCEILLSLCMIVKNEEKNLNECLELAKTYVDEIVIVDTGSMDNTVEIAKKHGAKIYHFDWIDDFSSARNESLNHAEGKWILVLDADERIKEEDGRIIRESIKNNGYVAYYLKLYCPKIDDGGVIRLNWYPRLFKNYIGAHFSGYVHEQIYPSLYNKGDIGVLDIEIQHTGYLGNMMNLLKKAERNLKLLKKQLQDTPDSAYGYFQYAETCASVDRFEEAEKAFRRAISLSRIPEQRLSDNLIAIAYMDLGSILIKTGEIDEGIQELKKSLNINNYLLPALLHVAMGYYIKGNYDEAIDELNNLLERMKCVEYERYIVKDFEINPWFVYHKLGQCYHKSGKTEVAEKYYKTSIEHNPDYLNNYWSLAEIYVENKSYEKALQYFMKILSIDRDNKDASENLNKLLEHCGRFYELNINLAYENMRLNDYAGAEKYYKKAIELKPDSIDAMQNLGLMYIKIGKIPEARKILSMVLDLCPSHEVARRFLNIIHQSNI